MNLRPSPSPQALAVSLNQLLHKAGWDVQDTSQVTYNGSGFNYQLPQNTGDLIYYLLLRENGEVLAVIEVATAVNPYQTGTASLLYLVNTIASKQAFIPFAFQYQAGTLSRWDGRDACMYPIPNFFPAHS